jgi:hypothetical protein
MLKIGTSKMGSVVECPRCHKSIVVPPQSTPQAEQLYRMLKNKRSEEQAAPLPEEPVLSEPEPTAPESAWDELGGNVDDASLNQWIDELWTKAPAPRQEPTPMPLPSIDFISPVGPTADTLTILALKKQQRLTMTLLFVSAIVAFFVGIVFGFLVHRFFIQPSSHQYAAENVAGADGFAGTLFYLNENGERRADTDAAVICLPRDRLPSPLLSCQGLRPQDAVNNDTVQLIHELGGMYERADANGVVTLLYREGVRYLVVFISAHQIHTNGVVKPSVLKDLRQYFHNPELFSENCLIAEEYDLSQHSFRHTFERVD